jgi:hypothetical protein
MAEKDGSQTVNTGGAAKPTAEDHEREFDIGGNTKMKGEKVSPSDRDRGEASSADPATAIPTDR